MNLKKYPIKSTSRQGLLNINLRSQVDPAKLGPRKCTRKSKWSSWFDNYCIIFHISLWFSVYDLWEKTYFCNFLILDVALTDLRLGDTQLDTRHCRWERSKEEVKNWSKDENGSYLSLVKKAELLPMSMFVAASSLTRHFFWNASRFLAFCCRTAATTFRCGGVTAGKSTISTLGTFWALILKSEHT